MHVAMKGGGGASRWKAPLAAFLDATELSHTRATYIQHTGTEFGSVQGIFIS